MQIVLKTMHILLWIIGLFAVLISFFLQNYCPAQGRLSGCFLPDMDANAPAAIRISTIRISQNRYLFTNFFIYLFSA